jgi:hypothetical protein
LMAEASQRGSPGCGPTFLGAVGEGVGTKMELLYCKRLGVSRHV